MCNFNLHCKEEKESVLKISFMVFEIFHENPTEVCACFINVSFERIDQIELIGKFFCINKAVDQFRKILQMPLLVLLLHGPFLFSSNFPTMTGFSNRFSIEEQMTKQQPRRKKHGILILSFHILTVSLSFQQKFKVFSMNFFFKSISWVTMYYKQLFVGTYL